MTSIAARLQQIRARIQHTAVEAGRAADEIQLLAVSKTHSAEQMRELFALGCRAFGESYWQEAEQKLFKLNDLPIEWHFIGPIQSNKTANIAQHFTWVQSVARLKIAQRLNDQRPEDQSPLQVCIQVNLSAEASKHGVSLAELPALAIAVAELPRLQLRGLMAIPAMEDNPQAQRAAFARLREALQDLNKQGLALDTLSMGMSGDMEAAIMEGATVVRIGTDLFGPRPSK